MLQSFVLVCGFHPNITLCNVAPFCSLKLGIRQASLQGEDVKAKPIDRRVGSVICRVAVLIFLDQPDQPLYIRPLRPP